MNRVQRIAANPSVQKALGNLRQGVDEVVDRIVQIQQIPSPTFEEQQRAAFLAGQFREMGLVDVHQDDLYNVYGRFPGQGRTGEAAPTNRPAHTDASNENASERLNGTAARVVVSAHLDTVFPAGTDLTVRRENAHVYGPGIGDNSTGLAGLLTLAQMLGRYEMKPERDIWFVANVGEEGLGDLRGMRRVVERFGGAARYIVVEGGLFGQIFHRGIAVRRYRITARTPGGHSWGSFGHASAIHELARLVVAIDHLDTPSSPKTTYNIGIIEGGRSVNTIAERASLLLDLRSESSDALAQLVAKVERLVAKLAKRPEVTVEMEMIGNRPLGAIPADAPLVSWAYAALRAAGQKQIEFVAGSTDANAPLSKGYEAVCIGLARASNTHRLDEYVDTRYLADGLTQLLLLTLAAADFGEA